MEYIPKEVLIKIKDKSITHNIFRKQDNECIIIIIITIICIAFIEYMLARKTLSDYTNLFSPNDYKKNDKIIICILKINMAEEASLEFRSRKSDEKRNYFLEEI